MISQRNSGQEAEGGRLVAGECLILPASCGVSRRDHSRVPAGYHRRVANVGGIKWGSITADHCRGALAFKAEGKRVSWCEAGRLAATASQGICW